MTSEQIRSRYISRLRNLYRLVGRLERLYPDFPEAPADTWRAAIISVAAHIKAAANSELLKMTGSHLALRNLVADSMHIEPHDGRGGTTYGHRVLDINWE